MKSSKPTSGDHFLMETVWADWVVSGLLFVICFSVH